MARPQIIEQSILIPADVATIDHCITDQKMMHRWLNPALRCEPVGEWSTQLHAQTRFVIRIPLLQPTLSCKVIERRLGLIVWQFQGFFQGSDRWECREQGPQTLLLNRFQFTIPNPIIQWGYRQFAANWTQKDMSAQLQRIKHLCNQQDSGRDSP